METESDKYLESCKKKIRGIDGQARKAAREHWNGIAKPLYGLGLLEDALVQIAGIQGTHKLSLEKKAVAVMCADNGIVEEGVSQSGHEVTTLVTGNIARGLASVSRMAACAKAEVYPVDVGMHDTIEAGNLIHRKTRNGTRNFSREPAMDEPEMLAAIRAGVETVEMLARKEYHIAALGEMGIGNTTTSSAVASVLLSLPAAQVTGPGAGLEPEGVRHKAQVIASAVASYGLRREETLRTLQTVGGFDLCALAGACIGGAIYGIPIVLDGLITAVAALAACRLIPEVREYLLASHLGKEPAMAAILQELKLRPVIHANLALGEGTGAVAFFPLLDMAYQVYRENATFQELALDAYQDYGAEKRQEC